MATARGRSHEKTGQPCQDKACSLETLDMSVSALADGAGSAALSHYGAQAVVKNICFLLKDHFDEFYNEKDGVKVKQTVLKEANISLARIAAKRGCSIKDLSCTLLFTAVKNDRFIIGHVGDGVIGCLKNGEAVTVSAPSNGEFSNTTCFVTSSSALADFRLYKGNTDGINAFCMMTDGPEAGLYDKRDGRLAPALRQSMLEASDTMNSGFDHRLNTGVAFLSKNVTFDDCGLVISALPIARYSDFKKKSADEQWDTLFRTKKNCSWRRRLEHCTQALENLSDPKTEKETAKKINMDRRYVQKAILPLAKVGLVKSLNGRFIAVSDE